MVGSPGGDAQLDAALPYVEAEVVWAVREEMARTVEDVLARRTRALLLDARASLRAAPGARERIVTSEAVIAAHPDVILASWCGKKVVPRQIADRAGWAAVPAVANNRIVEIKSTLILQPGPAALSDGVSQMHARLAACV